MDHRDNSMHLVRQYFLDNGSCIKVPKDTEIIAMNDDRGDIYLIVSGYFRVYATNFRRREEFTHILYGPGEIFPMGWLTKQKASLAYYVSLTPAEIYRLSPEQFKKDMLRNNQLAYAMLQQTLEQYRIFTMRVNNLEYKYARERLAYRLLFLANRFGQPTPEGVVIAPPLTHQLLASSLNLSRESVSREIEKFARKGLVAYTPDRQIILKDMAELSQQEQVPLNVGLPSWVTSIDERYAK